MIQSQMLKNIHSRIIIASVPIKATQSAQFIANSTCLSSLKTADKSQKRKSVIAEQNALSKQFKTRGISQCMARSLFCSAFAFDLNDAI